MPAKPVFILNGPNLNLLGTREPDIYGHETLGDIETACAEKAKALGLSIDFRQSNHEGTLVDWVQEARENACGLVINPGAYTHTSVALLDALSACDIAKIELHLSNIHAREEFRRHSVTAAGVNSLIAGIGAAGYPIAIEALNTLLKNKKT